jgi:hypothetical protein
VIVSKTGYGTVHGLWWKLKTLDANHQQRLAFTIALVYTSYLHEWHRPSVYDRVACGISQRSWHTYRSICNQYMPYIDLIGVEDGVMARSYHPYSSLSDIAEPWSEYHIFTFTHMGYLYWPASLHITCIDS